MRIIKLFLRKYFGFTQNEVNGYIILQTLLVLILFLPLIVSKLYVLPSDNYSKDIAQLDSLANILASHEKKSTFYTSTNPYKKATSQSHKKINFFKFDPNKATLNQLKSLGIKPSIAKIIIKYRKKGGVFKIKKDLTKIYHFPKDLYEKLSPYIQLPTKIIKPKNKKEQKPNAKILVNSTVGVRKETILKKIKIQEFDLNTADTTTLKQIKGIGSKISQRIVKFRDRMGGFQALSQLKDVYGLKEDVYKRLKDHSYLSDFNIIKISINKVNIKTLISHPYINYNQAKVIVNYREQHGKYTDIESLKKLKILDQIFLDKIKPYLSFD